MELKVSALEFARRLGQFADKALADPVHITKHGREHLVLLSADEYARLKRRDRQVITADNAPEWLIKALQRTDDMPPEAVALNNETEDWKL